MTSRRVRFSVKCSDVQKKGRFRASSHSVRGAGGRVVRLRSHEACARGTLFTSQIQTLPGGTHSLDEEPQLVATFGETPSGLAADAIGAGGTLVIAVALGGGGLLLLLVHDGGVERLDLPAAGVIRDLQVECMDNGCWVLWEGANDISIGRVSTDGHGMSPVESLSGSQPRLGVDRQGRATLIDRNAGSIRRRDVTCGTR